MTKKIVYIILIIGVFLGCSKEANNGFYEIKGIVKNLPNGSQVFLKNDDTGVIVDSTKVNESVFTLTGNVSYPQRYKLVYKNNKIEEHSIWLENIPIQIDFDFLKPKEVKIVAGTQQQLDEQLNKEIAFFNPEYERLLKEKKQDSIPHLINKLTKTIEQFTYKNINSYVAMEMLHNIRTNINKDTLCNKLQTVDKHIQNNSSYAKSLNVFCNSKILDVGDSFIDFTANTLDGERVVLSELIKEKKPVVLIFGGLQCMRAKGRTLLKSFNETNKNKVNILPFVFANTKEQWLHDETYNIGVPLVSDLKGNHSPVKIQYNVQATPTVYVLDTTGKISMISLGYGDNVNEHLKTILN
ncbi:MAG: DUF4369 domain-containing protein [Flavobacteriaceae bacterium]|nr:DUF4369 domain-containing protein [Flavobacteriaceae bacterium]